MLSWLAIVLLRIRGKIWWSTMSSRTGPKTALREFIIDLMNSLNIEELNQSSNIIMAYIDFYLNYLTDEQALKILINLDNACKLAKKHIKAMQNDN